MRARLQKLLAEAGLASRREAERWIRAGRVRVNGAVATLGDSADPEHDRVEVDGRPLPSAPRAYWMLHKPRGVLSTRSDPRGRPTVLEALPPEARALRLFPVGRLDRDSEGLLLLTNDGALTHALLHPSRGNERSYALTVQGRLDHASARELARGVRLEDGPTLPAQVGPRRFDARANTTRFELTVIEGRKRQIRRALAALGHPVRRLVRVRVGPLRLGRLAAGDARPLRSAERRALLEHAAQLDARAGKTAAGAARKPARRPAKRRARARVRSRNE